MADRVLGLIGLGHMGTPMAERLVAAGHRVVGFDASPAGREDAAARGIEVLADAGQVGRAAQVVILMLPNSDIVESVAAQLAAIPAAERAVSIVVDMSSSEPERTRALAARLAEDGIELVDAPVSGGVVGAVGGTLTIMVGGSVSQFDDLAGILDALGSRVVRAGDVGAGHAVKALNNLMSAAHLLVSDEAAIAATRFGVDPEVFLAIVNTSSGRSGSTELKLPRYVVPGTFDSGFSAALLEKDVRIATALGRGLGLDMSLSDAVRERWEQLNAELPAGADHTEIIRPLERRAGVEVRDQSRADSSSAASSGSVPVTPTEQ
ncbi:MAG: NAD(P)-dependent oxidoreductase [Microbacterium sp.]|uniref:NAD(P)-dependent oxidoreductase n=1 Tax=Bacteria TaxID=2 RepID=UPI000A984BAC|nr:MULTISPECIES: NAD(P)-dependent oxidoreductase [Bacteria]MBN9154798.1 NAD(P)-dependent oxidoreductase [Microbacterium sp.]